MTDEKNLLLLGYAGTGKSAIGRAAADKLGFSFIEGAERLREITGFMPQELLRKHGLVRYRSEQRLLYNKLACETQCVIAADIAAGEGTLLAELCQRSCCILLCADTEQLYKRLQRRSRSRLTFEQLSADIALYEASCREISNAKLRFCEPGVEAAADKVCQTYYSLISK